jgi:hypothetical protein
MQTHFSIAPPVKGLMVPCTFQKSPYIFDPSYAVNLKQLLGNLYYGISILIIVLVIYLIFL